MFTKFKDDGKQTKSCQTTWSSGEMVDCKDKCVNWIWVFPLVFVCAVCTGKKRQISPANTIETENTYIYHPTSHQRGRGKEASLPSFTSSIFPTYLPGYLFNSMLWWCYGNVCVFTLLYSYRTAPPIHLNLLLTLLLPFHSTYELFFITFHYPRNVSVNGNVVMLQ